MHPPPKRKSRLTHAWSHELSKTCKGHSKSAKAVQLVDSVLDVGQRLKLSYTIVVFIDKDKLSICLQLYPWLIIDLKKKEERKEIFTFLHIAFHITHR